MSRVTLKGWKVGFRKISAVKVLQRLAGYSLCEAKLAVDQVLEGHPVDIDVPTDQDSASLALTLRELGVKVK